MTLIDNSERIIDKGEDIFSTFEVRDERNNAIDLDTLESFSVTVKDRRGRKIVASSTDPARIEALSQADKNTIGMFRHAFTLTDQEVLVQGELTFELEVVRPNDLAIGGLTKTLRSVGDFGFIRDPDCY